MTRLAATLVTAGLATIALAAVQLLPPRDGGAAQAGTVPPVATRAWADPPRASAVREAPLAAAAPAPIPVSISSVPQASRPAPAVAEAGAGPPARAARHRRAAARAHARAVRRSHPAGSQVVQARVPTQAAGRAPVRMAGPVGDILHGLGLD